MLQFGCLYDSISFLFEEAVMTSLPSYFFNLSLGYELFDFVIEGRIADLDCLVNILPLFLSPSFL